MAAMNWVNQLWTTRKPVALDPMWKTDVFMTQVRLLTAAYHDETQVGPGMTVEDHWRRVAQAFLDHPRQHPQ